MADVILCSCHTTHPDDVAAGDRLRGNLDGLGLAHDITVIPDTRQRWTALSRRTLAVLHDVCTRHPAARVIWMDVDCTLDSLPDLVRHSTADLIGFQYGFQPPLKTGPKDAPADRARFWDTAFLGVGPGPAARAFVARAAEAERLIQTDTDAAFLLAEAWRVSAPGLSFQVIPAARVADHSADMAPFLICPPRDETPEPPQQTLMAPPKAPAGLIGRLRQAWRPAPPAPVPAAAPAPTPKPPLNLSTALAKALDQGRAGRAKALDKQITKIRSRRLLTTYQDRTVQGARSFLTYADTTVAPDQPPLHLLWWDKPYPGNFGDWLSPLIMRHMAGGRRVLFTPHKGPYPGRHIIGLGSIARFINPQAVVVGTGVNQRDVDQNVVADYVSVRGTITADEIRRLGGTPPDSFGDPGLVMSRILPLTRGATNGRIALIRHYMHRRLWLRLPDGMDEFSIIQSDPDGIADFLRQLIGYDRVVTSAMHIYILCHSYGIPCALVTFEGGEDLVQGDGVKYLDYATGAGAPVRAPDVIPRDLRHFDFDPVTVDFTVSAAKIDEVEAALTAAIARHDQG